MKKLLDPLYASITTKAMAAITRTVNLYIEKKIPKVCFFYNNSVCKMGEFCKKNP
jgi:hypothetical protein